MATVDSELLTPTLAAHRPRDWTSGLPWRPSSQVYVGLFGGPIAVTLIAALNTPRLRMPRATVWLMVLFGLAGTLVGVVCAVAMAGDAPQLFVQLAGVVTAGPLYLLQRSPDRVHSTFSPNEDHADDHASLVGPGLAAIVAGVLAEVGLIAALERLG